MTDKEIIIPISKIKTKNLDQDTLIDEAIGGAKFEIDKCDDNGMRPLSAGNIAVKFPKFLQLIATHDFDEMVEKHHRQDVIISPDLLVDLAGSQFVPENEGHESRFSWLFLGLVMGLICAAVVFLIFLK